MPENGSEFSQVSPFREFWQNFKNYNRDMVLPKTRVRRADHREPARFSALTPHMRFFLNLKRTHTPAKNPDIAHLRNCPLETGPHSRF